MPQLHAQRVQICLLVTPLLPIFSRLADAITTIFFLCILFPLIIKSIPKSLSKPNQESGMRLIFHICYTTRPTHYCVHISCLSVHLSVCLSIHPSIHPSIYYLSVHYPSMHLSIIYLSIHPLFIYPSTYCLCTDIYLSIYPSTYYLSIHPLSIYASIIYLSFAYLSIHPSIYLSMYQSIIYLPIHR